MENHFYLFEFGSTSLKMHYRLERGQPVQRYKIPWELGHEVFCRGRISGEAMASAIGRVQRLLVSIGRRCEPSRAIAFATGVFREAVNMEDFVDRLHDRTGLRLHVVSGDEEAALLKALYLRRGEPGWPFVFDLGGGSLQWVHVRSRNEVRRDSLPLGAIRLYRMAGDSTGNFLTRLAFHLTGRQLSELPHIGEFRVVGTGGTVSAISRVFEKEIVSRDDVRYLRKHVQTAGPPSCLKPHRRPIFLPGLVIVERLMEEVGAEALRYQNLSVGSALVEKVLPLYTDAPAVPRPSFVMRNLHMSAIVPVS